MKNSEFIRGIATKAITSGKNGNVSVRDGLVYSYYTVVAELRVDGLATLTTRKYSQTTSRHVKTLAVEATRAGLKVEYADF